MFQVGGHVIELYIEVQGSMVSYAMIKKKTADFLWLTWNSKQGKHDFIDDTGFSAKITTGMHIGIWSSAHQKFVENYVTRNG